MARFFGVLGLINQSTGGRSTSAQINEAVPMAIRLMPFLTVVGSGRVLDHHCAAACF
jgi:hypothetical protein